MINSGIFFNRKLKIDNIFFDGHMSEMVDYTVTPTEQPVEYGANVTDNAIVQPYQLNFVAYVTEFIPLSLNPLGIFNAFKRTSDAVDVLHQAMVTRDTVDVVCNLGSFTNLLITNVRMTNERDTLTTVNISISLQQLYFVGEVTANDPDNKDYSPTKNRGGLQPKSTPQ